MSCKRKKNELQQKHEQAFVSGTPRLISLSKQQMIPTLQMISPGKNRGRTEYYRQCLNKLILFHLTWKKNMAQDPAIINGSSSEFLSFGHI